MMTVRYVATLLIVGSVGLTACNDVPVAGVLDSFSVQVTDSRSSTDTVKLDFLWVIDNSVSMCQEQAALADNISTSLSKLEGFVNVDVRFTSTVAPSSPRDPEGKGPLVPVSTYVNMLRSINPDPSRVLVAAIVGDVIVSEGAFPKCSKPAVPYCLARRGP